MSTALGVDVGVRKGLDVLLMDGALKINMAARHVSVKDLPPLLEEVRPDVVAIDSPPWWSRGGGNRETERILRRLGLMSYGTPSDPRKGDHRFYAWMRVGFEVFEAAAAVGYARYQRGPIQGTAIEVFPHATATALAGCLPPKATRKRAWRTSVLERAGVSARKLESVDQIDAAYGTSEAARVVYLVK